MAKPESSQAYLEESEPVSPGSVLRIFRKLTLGEPIVARVSSTVSLTLGIRRVGNEFFNVVTLSIEGEDRAILPLTHEDAGAYFFQDDKFLMCTAANGGVNLSRLLRIVLSPNLKFQPTL